MSKDEKISVSEHFYSLQGEGPSAGRPAVFLRLRSCNLLCGGQGTQFDKKLHNGATWRCDTIETWLHGELMTLKELGELFFVKDYIRKLLSGAHLIITGGEPMLQIEPALKFIDFLYENYSVNSYLEIETNGTILPPEDALARFHQVNCSPKLASSGVPREKRYRPEALEQYIANKSTFLKFVISSYDDWKEVERDFLDIFEINPRRVYLMPAASTREELWANSMLCAELAKEHLCNYSPRLHVEIWNQTVGV